MGDEDGRTALVRPFAARVVRPDRAPSMVRPMVDPPGDTEPPPVELDAYVESTPALYVYRQHDERSSYTGLVCELAVSAFADGQVRGHEAVTPSRVEALLRHHATALAAPALVTLLHAAGPAFRQLLEETSGQPPVLDFPGPQGLQQTVWRVPEGPLAAAVVAELAATRHYIADGHHRVTAALEQWRRSGSPGQAGLLCVVHATDDLRLAAFHRRVQGPVDTEALLRLLAGAYTVHPAAHPPSPEPGALGLYSSGRWFDVRYPGPRAQGTAGLDAAILQARVLDHLPVDVDPVRGPVDELTRACDRDGGALFTLAPPALRTLTGLADAGELMPPKTTFFAPKPCAGIFLHR